MRGEPGSTLPIGRRQAVVRSWHARVVRLAAAVLAIALGSLGLATSAGAVAVAPLSPVPTGQLSCDTATNTTTLTITWGIGEYGNWRVGVSGGFTVTGGPATYTAVTTTTYTAPNGILGASLFRLNNNPTDNGTGDNQAHGTITGESCPFDPGVRLDVDCVAGTITITVAAGRVTSWVLFDTSTSTWRRIAGSGFFGSSITAPATLGPFPLGGATSVWFEATISGTTVELSQGTRCTCTWTSPKDFSNVIVQYADGTEVRFDDLDGRTFTIPNDPDNPIVAVWIKAGNGRLDPLDPAPTTFHDNGIGVYHGVDNCVLD